MLEATGTVERINIVTDAGRRFSFTLEDAVKLVEQVVPLLVERGWEFKPCMWCGSVTDIHADELCLESDPMRVVLDAEIPDDVRERYRAEWFARLES